MINAAIFPQLPTPSEWLLDWNALVARFAWLRAMADVPQDPVYHAEGDVLTHHAWSSRRLSRMRHGKWHR